MKRNFSKRDKRNNINSACGNNCSANNTSNNKY